MHVDQANRPIAGSPLVVAGGSRGTGGLVASLARADGREVRIVDAPGPSGSLASAVAGAGAVVLVPARGIESVAAQAAAVLGACGPPPAGSPPGGSPRLVLVSGFSVGHGPAHALNTPDRLKDRMAAEELFRCSGRPYTVVRPTWLTDDPPGHYTITLTQDPITDGMIARADLAAVCLAAIAEQHAHGKTFAVFAEPGSAPTDWAARFAALAADDCPGR